METEYSRLKFRQNSKNIFLYLGCGIVVLCLIRLLEMLITANVCDSIPESQKMTYIMYVLKGMPLYIIESLAFLCPLWFIFKVIKSISSQPLFWVITGLHFLFVLLINGLKIYETGKILVFVLQAMEILLCMAQFVIFVLNPVVKYKETELKFRQRAKTYLQILLNAAMYMICLIVFYFSTVLILFNLSDGLYIQFDKYGEIYNDLGPAGALLYFYIVMQLVFILSTFVMNMFKKSIDDKIGG